MSELLSQQNKYFLLNEDMLYEKYMGQYIVIHNEKVADSFGSERDAYIYSVKHFQMGTFLIRKVRSKDA